MNTSQDSAPVEYCRIQDGEIVEYPVLELHIQNRAHSMDMYTRVVHLPKPQVPEFFYLTRKIQLAQGVPVVSYALAQKELDAILADMHFKKTGLDKPVSDNSRLTYNDLSQETFSFVVSKIEERLQKLLDAWCNERGYDNIVSLASYANSQYEDRANEARHGIDARDALWTSWYLYVAKIKAGTVGIPLNFNQVLGEVSVPVW